MGANLAQVILGRAKSTEFLHDVLQYRLRTPALTKNIDDALVCISPCAGVLSRFALSCFFVC